MNKAPTQTPHSEGAAVDLFSHEDGVKLFPGDPEPESLSEIISTIDWINDFDARCRGPEWKTWKKTADKAFDFFRGK